MPALVELHAENFKSLRRVDVKLGDLNVLVGPNGAGKTNFLDLIDFLGDSVRTDLRPALDVRGGFDRVVFRGAGEDPRRTTIRIRVVTNVTDFSSPTALDEYRLSISSGRVRNGQRRLIRREWFKFKRTQGRGRRIEINGGQLGIFDEKAPGQDEAIRKEPILQQDSGLRSSCG